MADKIKTFQEHHPSFESYWRSVILFGRNVASYKFALAKSLLKLSAENKTEIGLHELAVPFSEHICSHLRNNPKQCTSNSSAFLSACVDYNDLKIPHNELLDITVRQGFKHVIDAFHVVNEEKLPIEFYNKDYKRGNKKIILTDELYRLKELPFFDNFEKEIESRWNLVETAWELGLSRNLVSIQHDNNDNSLFIQTDKLRRKNVTSSKSALNGYQKGKCFYCFGDISLIEGSDAHCDVDHFFPHTLQAYRNDVNLNGVWNLVLSCQNCNRGHDGKFAKVPDLHYLDRLHKRNEFLINSHHPLRETLINQTGKTELERVSFLRGIDEYAINMLIHRWRVDLNGEAIF